MSNERPKRGFRFQRRYLLSTTIPRKRSVNQSGCGLDVTGNCANQSQFGRGHLNFHITEHAINSTTIIIIIIKILIIIMLKILTIMLIKE